MMTDLSIIIVCYKGWNRLTKCLEALASFRGNNFSTEVIVVDNRSDDNTILNIEERFPKFRFIFNNINGGFANGCNLGARNSKGEFLLFLNPDTIATEAELEKLLNTSKQNPTFTILSCRQVNENGKESIASGPFPQLFNLTGFQRAVFRTRKSEVRIQNSEVSFPDWISGSVVLMRHETFNRLRGFDEDFWMYFEDVDLCRRARNIGGEIAFCRNITIEHNHGGSSRINLKTTSVTKTEVHISRHVYVSKHKTGTDRVLIQTFLILNNLLSGGLVALLGLLFFFIPKVFARTLIYLRLINYYTGSIFRLSWISPRSVNFRKRL
ncbi:MAG: glycosyltransferase family 2 protein [Bacteroidia bacterium]|nr:glycosyltransferase family 2 protein [Bacteroidia bacterium]